MILKKVNPALFLRNMAIDLPNQLDTEYEQIANDLTVTFGLILTG